MIDMIWYRANTPYTSDSFRENAGDCVERGCQEDSDAEDRLWVG